MLCPTHKSQKYSPATGRCQTCPNSTPNRTFKLCYRCSASKHQCQVCLSPVGSAATPPAIPPASDGTGSKSSTRRSRRR